MVFFGRRATYCYFRAILLYAGDRITAEIIIFGDDMSQTTPDQLATPAAPAQQQSGTATMWSTLNVEPERRDVGDDIVRHIVAPLSAQAKTWGGYRFGFTRNLESNHPSVQLHLSATDAVVERVWTSAHALTEECRMRLGPVTLSRQPDIIYPPRPGEPLSERMESSFARFGGLAGLQLIGDISELSSDLALWAVNRFPSPNMRSILASLLLFDTAHAMMRGPRSNSWPDRRTTSWDFYWNAHLHACTVSFGPVAEHARKAMLARMAPRIMPTHRVMAALASEPSVDLWRRRWAQAIDLYLYRADKQRISRSAQHLTMAASRLLMNRLGFPLREEATLGQYAHAWSKDLEAQYSGKASAHSG